MTLARLLRSPILATLLAGAPVAAGAQETPADTTGASVEPVAALEALADEEQTPDPEDLVDTILDLRDNPLDVNEAGVEELSVVPGVGPIAARAIVARRGAYGPIDELDDLLDTSILTPAALEEARPFLVVRTAQRSRFPPAPRALDVVRGLRLTLTQRAQARLDVPRGYTGDDSVREYRGSPVRLYGRAQAQYRRNLIVNLTLEKDPGEAFADRALGYDHVSAGAGVMRVGRIEALVIGDFVAGFGQGLALWRAAGMGKGSDTTRGPVRSGRGLQTYGSAEENRYLRGAGATVAVTPWLLASAFASRRRLDASIVVADSAAVAAGDVPGGAASHATSLAADGLHRTAAELARRAALGETLLGGAIEGRFDGRQLDARVGAVGYRSRFDMPVVGADRPDARYAFRGSRTSMLSLFGDVRTSHHHAFGEVGRDARGAIGAIAGTGVALGAGSELLVVARRYPRDFVTLHGYPFGERNGTGQNEAGIYVGARVRTERLLVSGYVDLYRFPWLRFTVPRPSTGHELLFLLEYRPSRWLRAHVQTRAETREAGAHAGGTAAGSLVGGLHRETRRTVRLQAEFDASRSLRLRTRVEAARAHAGDAPASDGLLLFHDIRYVVRRGFRVDSRLTIFQTDDFQSRLYQLEGDVAGAFSLPVLHGRGARAYVAVTVQALRTLTLQARLSATFLEDTTRIGSGPDELAGSRAADLSVQARMGL